MPLKPCPWCGKADMLEIDRPMQTAASNYCVVRCNRCGISGPRGENAMARDERTRRRVRGIDAEASAADAWDRRAMSPGLPMMVSLYADALGRHGPDSPQAAEVRAVYADEPGFPELADTIDRIKRHLGGSGIDYPPVNPQPRSPHGDDPIP